MVNVPKGRSKISRRRFLIGAAGTTAVAGAVSAGFVWSASAQAAENGHGLTITDSNENGGRLQYYRFGTDAIEWDPAVNILLPDGYHDSGKHYPVLYLLHGGGGADFRSFDAHHNIQQLTAGREVILVMPDASTGWYCNPVGSNTGPRDWETFHIEQLLPWVESNFRTFPEFNGRAVAGFSMGGFGALKYAAKYYGHFCSVSSHSGPASLRRDSGLVVHWANATSAALDLGGATVYGTPWDEKRVDADNPMQNIDRYADKRLFLVAGTSPDPVNWFDTANETQVLAGQREFRKALDDTAIPHDSREEPGGHVFRPEIFTQDLNGMLDRLRTAG